MYQILVIEDEPVVRANIIKILQFEKYETLGAENGETGLKLAEERRPDLILCDIMMPTLDGYEVRRRLSQDPATAVIPFVFLTAKADRADIRYGIELGADDYLTKPFNRDELLGAVRARLTKKATLDAQFQQQLNTLLKSVTEAVPDSLLKPITQIQHSLRTLNQNYASLDQSKILTITGQAYESSLHLERLLQNFLFYALLENTSKNPELVDSLRYYRTNSSKQLITDLANILARDYGRSEDLSLQLVESEVPILPANLAKIFEELLDNAFKFSPKNTYINVETTVEDNKFYLRIINIGERLTSKEIEELRTDIPFEQRLYKTDILGLGVALSKRLTELYGGQLTISSDTLGKITACVVLPTTPSVPQQSESNGREHGRALIAG
ncbi:MAG: response regulator [Thermosynechococcaceae cyanobacterium MS004]|nr:response regulator [Thermosynechococcaceae cyanobacterium MS004]